MALPLGVALTAFSLGVETTERDLEDAGLLVRLYYSAGLFVLGGLDLGTPTGGSVFGRDLMWFAYFSAPLVTTGVVAEGLLRAIRPQWMQLRGLHDHVVLVGLGSLGMLYLEGLRRSDPNRQVLVVDRDRSRANVKEAIDRHGVRFVQGDITHRVTRDVLRLDRAAGVVVMTKDDLLNLEAAWDIHDDQPDTLVVVHVADIAMRRRLSAMVDHRESGVRAFNSHRIAAGRLWRGWLEERFASTTQRDAVVLCGFGRFGQTILEYLSETAAGDLARVVVVDRKAPELLRSFEEQVPHGDLECVAVQGDLDDPATWDKVSAALGAAPAPPTYVLGVDDDRTNMRAAVRLRERVPDAAVVVRCWHQSRFADELASEYGFTVLALEQLLREAFSESHVDWFVVTIGASRTTA